MTQVSQQGVLFCDTLRAPKIPSRRKLLLNNNLQVTSHMAQPVPLLSASVGATNHIMRRLMKKNREDTGSSEPIGIVISRGDRTEPTPVFSAYIWGPAPKAIKESATRAA